MQGNIAQALALVVAGNAMLRGREVGTFWPSNGVFRFTKRCQFLSPPTTGPYPLSPEYVAQTPQDWFAREQKDCTGFRLRRMVRPNPTGIADMDNNRMSVGFVGGGPRWLVEVVRSTSELWEGRDELLDRDAPDRRIWATTYLRIADRWSADTSGSRDVAAISAELGDTLGRLQDLAAEIEMSQFVPSFKSAAADLTADPPAGAGSYRIWLRCFPLDLKGTCGYSPPSKTRGVFGGMGSWNDVAGLTGHLQARYVLLSDQLFGLLCEAIVAVANSTFAVPRPS